MCQHKRFWRGTKCSLIFGLAQNIWTSTKHFGTCKRTRHYSAKILKLLIHVLYTNCFHKNLPSNSTLICWVKKSSSIFVTSEHGWQSLTGSTNAILCNCTLVLQQLLQKILPHRLQWCWKRMNTLGNINQSRFRAGRWMDPNYVLLPFMTTPLLKFNCKKLFSAINSLHHMAQKQIENFYFCIKIDCFY